MKSVENIGLKDVQAVYSGPEGDLWELIMGQQIHIGGLASSMALCQAAGIAEGTRGVDFCCCTGAGMRFLIRFCKVAGMTGIDATEKVIKRGRELCQEEHLSSQIRFIHREVCDTGLAPGEVDFVWGEDAWCYVEHKDRMIAEAARILKAGGAIAFTDWIEGNSGLSNKEGERFLRFMKFPNIFNRKDYKALLKNNGFRVTVARDTKQFAPFVDLYLDMLNKQFTYDAMKIIGFDAAVMKFLAAEMVFMQKLAHQRKIAQGLFVARKM